MYIYTVIGGTFFLLVKAEKYWDECIYFFALSRRKHDTGIRLEKTTQIGVGKLHKLVKNHPRTKSLISRCVNLTFKSQRRMKKRRCTNWNKYIPCLLGIKHNKNFLAYVRVQISQQTRSSANIQWGM